MLILASARMRSRGFRQATITTLLPTSKLPSAMPRWCFSRDGHSSKRSGCRGIKPDRSNVAIRADASQQMPRKKQKVAVVGAGAAGLTCSRELRDEGHEVIVFEQAPVVGGTWVLDSAEKLLEDGGMEVHSSMYDSLRTNIPREVMSFCNFPFTTETLGAKSVDSRQYPNHREVLAYLELFADAFDLRPMIRFHTHVENMERLKDSNQWSISSRHNGESKNVERFDAAVICNGHYSKPYIPILEGQDEFSGLQLHSHTYRNPQSLAGKVVVVFGVSASGQDIARELSTVCEAVYWSGRSPDFLKGPQAVGSNANIPKRSAITKLGENGEVWFQNGEFLQRVDAIMYCTGYEHSHPYLSDTGLVTTEGNRVSPLYKHIFVPKVAPSLAFVGLPKFVIPFPLFEYQSKYIARVLSGRCQLPSREQMEFDMENFYKSLQEEGRDLRFDMIELTSRTHDMRFEQFPYIDWLRAQCGSDVEVYPKWRSEMFELTSKMKKAYPESYREQTIDGKCLDEAKKDFSMITLHTLDATIST